MEIEIKDIFFWQNSFFCGARPECWSEVWPGWVWLPPLRCTSHVPHSFHHQTFRRVSGKRFGLSLELLNWWKAGLYVRLRSGLIGSDPLLSAVLPMSFTLSITKFSIQPLKSSKAGWSVYVFLESKVTWMLVLGLACSGLKAPSFALNLCQLLSS